MTNLATSSFNEEKEEWVLVEEGLFDYPLKNGEKPALLGNYCTSCDRYFFPKRIICPYCYHTGKMETVRLGTRGTIYVCTVVHRDSPVGIKAPYAYGYVQIAENRLRVFALLTGSEPSLFVTGQKVELVVEPIMTDKMGRKVIGYKFRALP